MSNRVQSIVRTKIARENDIVFLRHRVKLVAEALGFEKQDQVRIATSVSELARNAYQYANGGDVELLLKEENGFQLFEIAISDQGPGIENLDIILQGGYISKTGMGLGLIGVHKLMDRVTILNRKPKGLKVSVEKYLSLSRGKITVSDLAKIAQMLAQIVSENPYREAQEQNQELLIAMNTLQEKREELSELNKELESTNRGVVALYAELEEKADALKRVSETKTAFLSNMTHEFRTPVNSILNIAAILLDEHDGVQDTEHLKQVKFIQKSALALSEFVNDLLDLSKVEAGKVQIRPTDIHTSDLFSTLRGLMKPLHMRPNEVTLEFLLEHDFELRVDEGKLSQVLRNLISNALKYTEVGTVTVSAAKVGSEAVFEVTDTGIGIAPDDYDRIFEEFTQIDSKLQKSVKGTGLGLPLSRTLTKLLGGRLTVESIAAEGSTFTVRIPLLFGAQNSEDFLISQNPETSQTFNSNRVLIIDDDATARYAVGHVVESLKMSFIHADNGVTGVELAKKLKPRAIVLDLTMPGMDGYAVLKELMSNSETREIPVILSSSQELSPESLQYFSQVVSAIVPKNEVSGGRMAHALKSILGK